MQNRKTWKSVGALLLTLAMLAGMLSVMGALPATAKTTTAMKFTADFSELSQIVTDNGGTFTDGVYRAEYTSPDDTTVAGKFNTWANERFATYQMREAANFVRAYFGQDSNNIQTYTDSSWGGNQYLAAAEDGYLQFYSKLTGGQMLRKGILLSPLYNGENVKLKNFEARITVRFTSTERQALMLNFHEEQAGKVSKNASNGDFATDTTGNAVVLGNGAGSYTSGGVDGIALYQKGDLLSATSVADEGNTNTNTAEIKVGEKGKRFASALTRNHDYILTVKALNGTATVTVSDAETNVAVYTGTMTYTTTDGYLSFGCFNSSMKVKSFEVAELDDKGNLVDFGTYAASLTDGIERFTASFDNMKDACYYSGNYYYSSNHDADKFSTDGAKTMTKAGTSYQIDMNDDALVDYLESKFAFYYHQEGHAFCRQNVNGLYVDADGNQLGYNTVKSDTKIYKPDTGEEKSYPQWIDYIGVSATGKKHFWTLYSNKWIGTSATEDGDSMYRHADVMTVKNADGTLAQFENFELETDFILRKDATHDYSNLTVAFRSPTPYIQSGNTDTALFAMSPNGGYIVGGGSSELTLTAGSGSFIWDPTTSQYDTWATDAACTDQQLTTKSNTATFTNQKLFNTATQSTTSEGKVTSKTTAIYPKVMSDALGVGEYHLKMRVVGKNVTVTVTDASGNEKFTINETTAYAGTGYLSLGGSNNAAQFANIVVTRLDSNGNAVDFSDVNEGYSFGANFGNLAEYRTDAYYRNNGDELSYLTSAGNPYAFTDETQLTDKAISDYLREKFDFYATKEGRYGQLANPYTSIKEADYGDAGEKIDADSVVHTARWTLRAGRWLSANFTGGTYGNDGMLRKTMSLVPKMNGEAVQTANFETEFDVHFGLNTQSKYGNEIGVLLSFRSDEAGRPATGYHSVQNNKDAILIHTNGIGIYDGVAVDYSYQFVNNKAASSIKQSDGSYCSEFTAWNNEATATVVHVYVKVVGKNLTVKVTESGTETVLYEATKTLSRMGSGYLYYSVCGAEAALADVRLNLLDRDGEVRTAEEAAMEGSAKVTAGADGLKAAGSFDSSTNKYPGGQPYISADTAKTQSVFDSINEYLNTRYDLYYQANSDVHKMAAVFGNDANQTGWYSHALYLGWAQFNANGFTSSDTTENLLYIGSLVPKSADGAQLKGKDCIADMKFRFDRTEAPALFGFRMAEAGTFTDDKWNPAANTSYLKITLNGVYLVDNGVEKSEPIVSYSYAKTSDLQMTLHVEVIGDTLTGYIQKDSDKHNFTATLTNNDAGYFAQGFANKAPNLLPMTIQVSDLPIGKAEQTEGGKLTVSRTASDKEGYLAWLVSVDADEGEQLKPNTLKGTDADDTVLYPTRVGYRSDNYDSNTFKFYSKGDATFTAEFYTPHTAEDITMPCLGTSVNAEKAGLRFINRINLYTGADGKVYTDIDGVPTEVADYGVIVATKSVLGEQELTYDLAQGTNRIVRRSVPVANKYYDYATDYVDVAVQITGLDVQPDLEICSRVYLKLANGTIIYSDMATRTYNQAKA